MVVVVSWWPVLALGWLISAALAGFIARENGRDLGTWVLIGLLFGVFAVVVAAVMGRPDTIHGPSERSPGGSERTAKSGVPNVGLMLLGTVVLVVIAVMIFAGPFAPAKRTPLVTTSTADAPLVVKSKLTPDQLRAIQENLRRQTDELAARVAANRAAKGTN